MRARYVLWTAIVAKARAAGKDEHTAATEATAYVFRQLKNPKAIATKAETLLARADIREAMEYRLTAVPRDASDKVHCPSCGEVLVIRHARHMAGREFVGCKGYPKCRYATTVAELRLMRREMKCPDP